jgi:magnesium transporter
MSEKIKRITIKSKSRRSTPGASPGSLQIDNDALKPRIAVYSYSKDSYEKISINNYAELNAVLNRSPSNTFWIDIKGLGDLELLKSIRDNFGISSLVFEDITHTYQRPKLEEFSSYCFAISRMLCLNEMEIENEQLSFILTEKILFTFQENYTDCLDPVRTRLEDGQGVIRTAGTSYMMYALMDVVLDNYFALINRFGEELDMLEERLYRRPDKSITFETHAIKRVFILVRRAIWPERDKLNDMLRSTSALITDETKTFLRDAYDHSIQLMDLVENYKEICSSLIDMYLSFNSNRMNVIMKVLTIISSIFIPLTFIAGVYGMNFAREDPVTGKILHENMPELYEENGYVYTLSAMAIIGFIQLLFFYRKGWFK